MVTQENGQMNLTYSNMNLTVCSASAGALTIQTGGLIVSKSLLCANDFSVRSVPLQALSLPVIGFSCVVENNLNSFTISVANTSVYTIISEKLHTFATVIKGAVVRFSDTIKRRASRTAVSVFRKFSSVILFRRGVLRL
jgi:hypothetical protein